MTLVITPVGTSLFTNGLETNTNIGTGFQHIKSSRATAPAHNARRINQLRKGCEAFIRNEKSAASAELQSIAKIQNTLQTDIKVRLIASDTVASKLAAEIISGNVAGSILGHQITVEFDQNQDVIEGLQVDNRKDFLKKGMINLIDRIQQINSPLAANDESLAINITGGYGATLPYLTIYAQLKNVPLYYNFEDSNELIDIPPSPLSIDWDKIDPYFDVLERIESGDALGKWAAFEKNNYVAVEKLGTFIWVDKRDNSAYLSPLGEVFWDECLKRKHNVPFPDPVTIPPDEIAAISDGISQEAHRRPRGWERVVESLCENAYVEYVRYDAQAHGGQILKMFDDGENGHIGVRYEKGGEKLPLRVETTARGASQTELVIGFIKRQLKRQLNL